jgi:uncharacterized oligopeptide transporter (OPT) family protein
VDFSRFLSPDVGAVGVLVLVVLLILWGMLLPRSTVNSLLRSKDEQIKLYREAYETSTQTVGVKDRQIVQLMEMARTTTHVIEAIPAAIHHERGDERALDQTNSGEGR